MLMNRYTFSFAAAWALILLVVSQSCNQYVDPQKEADALMELDRQFSIHSEEFGANHAFLDYIDDEAVLLRSNRYPIIGRENIVELFSKPDTGFVLTWEPSYATVSKSGDLGYTYGIYKTETLSPEGNIEIAYGTYVTIWKRDEKGKWKFVLDTGNPGLERKKPDLD
jgi:ketosteroid isomerase-like protein